MDNEKRIEVFILDDGILTPVEDWKQVEDPTVAEAVVIRNEFGQCFELSPVESDKDMKFDDALAWARERGGNTGTRKQWIDVYEAIHTAGLNDALRLIGGDPIRRDWYWTCEKDSEQSNASNAWIFNGNNGYLYYTYTRFLTSAARVFRAFQSSPETLNLSNLAGAEDIDCGHECH